MKITSVNNPLIKSLKKLKNKKNRNQEQMFLIEGYHLVQEAYLHGKLTMVLGVNEKDLNYDIPSYLVTKEIINKLSSTENPQMIVGVAKMFEQRQKIKNKILLLDDIQDPGNLGTIIRTAVAFGIDNIFLSENSVDLYNEKVIRATQGAIFKLPITRQPLKEVVKMIKKKKILIFGSTLVNGVSLNNILPCQQFALIMGNEARGLSSDLLALTDTNIYIPMKNEVESLNVGIAAAIILYKLIENDLNILL